ncbi:MAG: ABC transporter ATP-binding protein [Muribaculaceae bacterium]|nr:ABC transporter ATP-binding protein [Muribaculaceae bacterium]
MDNVYLRTAHLCIGYKRPLAMDLSLSLSAGHVTTLVGGNGIGKSTLLRTLTGDLKPLAGSVYIMEQDINTFPKRQLAKELSIVDTSVGMSGGLKVRQFIELGRQPYTGVFGLLKGADHELCCQAMSDTGISHKADSYMAELSDGERQKAMIARALAQDTPIMFLDEPFSFLDPAARLEIMSMLNRIASDKNKAILLTCHDVALCLRMATRLWLFLHDSMLLDLSPPEAIASGVLEGLYASDMVHFSPQIGDYIIK